MHRLILLALYSLFIFSASSSTVADSLLTRLDRMLPRRTEYEQDRRQRIDRAKADYETASTPSDKYNVLRDLYTRYRSYRIDSALIIADERLALAQELADRSKIASATINLAESYAKSGGYDRAIDLLDGLNGWKLEDYQRKYRNSVYRTAYDMKSEAALLNRERVDALEKSRYYRAQSLAETSAGSTSWYMLQSERLHDAGLMPDAVAKIEEAQRKFDFSANAPMQYAMGEIYLAAGMSEEAKECLARSAILDVSSGTKEYASLILLASVLFEEGDVRRAFEYINCAFEDAIFSKANFRTAEVMKIMPVIDDAFHLAERQAAERNRRYLAVSVVSLLLLLVSLLLLIRTLRRNRRMLATIADVNHQLESHNDDLVKADRVKLRYINTLMMAYAGYISKLKDFRKSVLRLMKTSQYQQAMDLVKSDRIEARELADFHEMFDEVFLSMFPDFVEKVNELFKSPVELKVPGRLTPELRVVAMMRLGLTSTDEIAKMLHYSSQTVYNHRFSIRSMIKVSKEEFEAAVSQI